MEICCYEVFAKQKKVLRAGIYYLCVCIIQHMFVNAFVCLVCVCVYIYAIMNDLTIRQQHETRREQRVFHGLGIPPFFWQLELVGIFFFQ